MLFSAGKSWSSKCEDVSAFPLSAFAKGFAQNRFQRFNNLFGGDWLPEDQVSGGARFWIKRVASIAEQN